MPPHVGPRYCIKGIQTVPALQIVGGELLRDVELRESQISPGNWQPVHPLPAGAIPKKYGVVQFRLMGNGMYQPVIRLLEQEIRLSEHQGGEILGCPGISYQTLLRLRANGFVRGRAITPKTTTISVESWLEHIDACLDPDFWTRERRSRFASPIR